MNANEHTHTQVTKDKDASVRGQDFEKAGSLRDREMELKAKIQAIIAGSKEQAKVCFPSLGLFLPCCTSCTALWQA
jgi:hypothetical protein